MKATTWRRRLTRAALAGPLVVALAAVIPADAKPSDIGRGDDGPSGLTLTYEVEELDVPGDWASGSSINNRGLVTGMSTDPDDGTTHATLWRDGVAKDLETLGGPNSAVIWPVKNDRGMVVGITETSDIDPRDEAWSCSAFFGVDTENACVGFVWERGKMRPLPTFGGTHGFAAGVNNRGQVVGWAETAKEDRTCNQENQFLGFHGAMWDTRTDRMHRLRPLRKDTASSATAINDRGQVVGISGVCSNAVGGLSAKHMVMWENGKVTKIDDLGGDAWNTPMAINQWGMVVGFANQPGTPGADFREEGFVWTKWTGTKPLGMLEGDIRSQASSVNNWGQIVGLSRASDGTREHRDHAVLWWGDQIVDLNDNDVTPGYDGHLTLANDINDFGVITGQAENADGESVAFVATPTWR